jgi:hypothetical protein
MLDHEKPTSSMVRLLHQRRTLLLTCWNLREQARANPHLNSGPSGVVDQDSPLQNDIELWAGNPPKSYSIEIRRS